MRRPSFGFVVDHPGRDLPGAISFARAALQRGCDAYLIPLYDQATDVPLLPLDALIVNFARPVNLDLVQGYSDAGLPVFVMDTEGGNHTVAGTNTPERLATLLQERGFAKYLAGYFFWGPRLRDVFAAQCGMSDDALIVSGCPRYDYASPRWRTALANGRQDYVLVNANYPLVNPRFVANGSQERRTAAAVGWNESYLAQLAEDMATAFRAFLATVTQLARDLPHVRFLVRPHPFESIEPYRRAFEGMANVTVDGNGDVLSVLAGASCLLHLNCATAVDALLLERLPISLEYLNTERLLNHAPLPSTISEHASSYNHLRQIVQNPAAYQKSFPFEAHFRSQIFPWFYENDGAAADRIVDALLARTTVRSAPRSIARSLSASRRNPRASQRLQSVAGNVLGSFATSQLRIAFHPARSDKQLPLSAVSASLRRLATLAQMPAPRVERTRHPVTRVPLASLRCFDSRG